MTASFRFSKLPNCQVLGFLTNFCPLKCKRSSLRSQCWMRLFLWFSNTVPPFHPFFSNEVKMGNTLQSVKKKNHWRWKKSLINGVNEWEIVRFHLCEIGSIDICQVRHRQRNIENMIPQLLGIHTPQNTTEGYFTHSSRSLIFFQDYFRGMSPSFTWVHVARCSFKIQMTFVRKVKEEM